MRVVLINTPYLDLYGAINVGHNSYFPLGLGYIAAVLRENKIAVHLLDPEAAGMSLEGLRTLLLEIKPDIVGISCATPAFKSARTIAAMVRQNVPALIVMGGVHVSSRPKEILEAYTEFDAIVFGEGEMTMLELCQSFQPSHFASLENISGLVYRAGGEVRQNKPRMKIENLDTLPLPARDLVNMDNYHLQPLFDHGVKSATMITSRGCPSHCTYCASFLTMGKKFRAHSPEYTIREIKHLVEKYGVRHIYFVDDTFTIDRERVLKICALLDQEKIRIKWTFFGRVDTVDEELLKVMREHGADQIIYGIESGDQQVLKNIRKEVTLEQCRQALAISNKLGYRTHAAFMIGLPGDTRESIERTINLAKELNPATVGFGIMVPYVGTPEFIKNFRGQLKDIDNWENWIGIGKEPPINLSNSGLSGRDLQKYLYKAYLSFYFRPRQILSYLQLAVRPRQFLSYLGGGFGLLRQMLIWKKRK